jgi:hypothetical protein
VSEKVNRAADQEPIQFDREAVVAQLAARASLRRGLGIIVSWVAIYFLIAFFVLPRLGLPDRLWVFVTFVPPVLAFLAIRQLQWSILASHQLRCPSCRHLLATERRWWNSPGSFCKACGKLAILPVEALKRAADT